MRVYYNEFDPFAAAWLRELMAAGVIPEGVVDERSIVDVQPEDVRGYDQCHFFAGLAGWAEALRLAGWGDRPVWTGSCPCQPFSVAGKGKGADDDRHLWPAWFRLIRECRPDVLLGEQVTGAIGHGWLDGVQSDLEGEGYAVGHCVLGAHSVGAPHIRQRLFWVADATGIRQQRLRTIAGSGGTRGSGTQVSQRWCSEEPAGSRDAGITWDGRDRFEFVRLADAYQNRPQGRLSNGEDEGRRTVDGSLGCHGDTVQPSMDSMPVLREFPLHNSPDARARLRVPADRGVADGPVQPIRLGDAASGGRGISGHASQPGSGGHAIGAGGTGLGFWSDYDVIHCRDGKFRRIPRQTQPSVQPVADGLPAGVDGVRIACEGRFPLAGKIPNRTGLLKGAGNAIVPQVAAEFVMAFMEARQ